MYKESQTEAERSVEVALLQGATAHNEQVSMLIYNAHQPSSDLHPFKGTAKTEFRKHVLRHAITEHAARQNNLGLVFGGDAH